MYRTIDIASITTIFALNEEEMMRREKVGTYIHSFSALVYERMYNHYLLKDPIYHSVLTSADVPRLIRMQSEYLSLLFIHPFDERLLERTRQIGDIHIAIGLEAIHIARGFNILSEIIIGLSEVNAQIREDIAIILKMLRISELIMIESYKESFVSYNKEKIEENEILSLFDKLFASLMLHDQSQKKVEKLYLEERFDSKESFASEEACPMSTILRELEDKKELASGFGIDLENIRDLHRRYHEKLEQITETSDRKALFNEIKTISNALRMILDRPLSDISTSLFLGVHSGIKFLHAFFYSTYEKRHEKEVGDIYQNLKEDLYKTLGWCIKDLYVGFEEPDRTIGYDLYHKIILKEERVNIAVTLKNIPNKIYMLEIMKILLEMVKQNFNNKERQAALLQLVDQVERASRSKDMFLANMSHELRTPLNAIIGFSQILGINPALPQNLKPYIDKIGIAGKSLLALVNTILDFAKLEAGKLTFKPEVTVVSELLRDVATVIEPMAQKKSIRFEYIKMISLGLYLDRQLIQQVFLNLLSNAVKFTPDGGSVTMSVKFDDEKKAYRFGVCDTGVGIEAKDIATLFDPFTQVENPFQKSAKGTGLGLAISKRIIEDLHGGQLWVESEPGKGSCFYFTIPVLQNQNTLERYVAQNEEAKRILIVEDESEYQKILIERLSDYYHLVITNSVNKAKELLESENFDFIVLDFFLVDGISSEILQFMERSHIGIPVIIISAEDDAKLIANLPYTEIVEGIFNKANIQEICNYLTGKIGFRGL